MMDGLKSRNGGPLALFYTFSSRPCALMEEQHITGGIEHRSHAISIVSL